MVFRCRFIEDLISLINILEKRRERVDVHLVVKEVDSVFLLTVHFLKYAAEQMPAFVCYDIRIVNGISLNNDSRKLPIRRINGKAYTSSSYKAWRHLS